MQNPIQKFRQRSIVLEKSGILSENLKTLRSCDYPTVQYFFAETLFVFCTYQCLQKGVRDFFYFAEILSYLQKIKKIWFLHTHFLFTFLLITQDLNKMKKISQHSVDNIK